MLLCESRELGGRGSSRLPCVTPVVKSSSGRVTFRIPLKINNGAPLRKQSTERVDCSRKKGAAKKLHRRPPTRFQIRIPLEMLLIWGEGGMQVHGIDRRRFFFFLCGHLGPPIGENAVYKEMVYKEMVEVRSNYKNSSCWWFGNPACGDSAESNWIEKDKTVYLLDLSVRMGEKGQCDLVCGASLHDWANAGLCWCPMHVHMVSVVLTFWVVGPVLRNGYGI